MKQSRILFPEDACDRWRI